MRCLLVIIPKFELHRNLSHTNTRPIKSRFRVLNIAFYFGSVISKSLELSPIPCRFALSFGFNLAKLDWFGTTNAGEKLSFVRN